MTISRIVGFNSTRLNLRFRIKQYCLKNKFKVERSDISFSVLQSRSLSSFWTTETSGEDSAVVSSKEKEEESSSSKVSRWQDIFPRDAYIDPWGDEIKPLAHGPLDKQSRYVIQLLQNIHHGVAVGFDRPTTKRCNQMIADLSDPSIGGNKLEGRAERAHEILRGMQLLLRPKGNEELFPFEIPIPDNETYLSVLRLYARPNNSIDAPMRCMEILRHKQQRAKTKERLVNNRHDDDDQLQSNMVFYPDVAIWNQVLLAWSYCPHEEKAYHAAKLLFGEMKSEENCIDSSSYSFVLRACAKSTESKHAKRLGFEVAKRVWTHLSEAIAAQSSRDSNQEGDDDYLEKRSHAFVFMLQSLAQGADERQKDEGFLRIMNECCLDGKVNSHVLAEFKRLASPQILDSFFRHVASELSNRRSESFYMALSTEKLFHALPASWTAKADIGSSGLGW